MPVSQRYDPAKVIKALQRAQLRRAPFGPMLLGVVVSILCYSLLLTLYGAYERPYQETLRQPEAIFGSLAVFLGLLSGLSNLRFLNTFRYELAERVVRAGLIEKLAMDRGWLEKVYELKPRMLSRLWFGKRPGNLDDSVVKLAIHLEWFIAKSKREMSLAWLYYVFASVVFSVFLWLEGSRYLLAMGWITYAPWVVTVYQSGNSTLPIVFFLSYYMFACAVLLTAIDYLGRQKVSIGIMKRLFQIRVG